MKTFLQYLAVAVAVFVVFTLIMTYLKGGFQGQQAWQKQQRAYEQQHHHEHGQQAKVNGGHKIAAYHRAKAQDDGDFALEKGLPYVKMRIFYGAGGAFAAGQLFFEVVDIVDAVINAYAYADGGDCDAHQIERQVREAHQRKDKAQWHDICEYAHQRVTHTTKDENEQHENHADNECERVKLRCEQALKHIVVKQHQPGELRGGVFAR